MTIDGGGAKLVLLCPAWRKYGTARTVKAGTVVLHTQAGGVVPFGDGEELIRKSGLPASAMARADAMMKGRKLPDAEMMQVKEHVMLCPNCKPRFEQMGGMKMLAQVVPVCRRPDVV